MTLYRESDHCPSDQAWDGNHNASFDQDCAYCGLEQIWVRPVLPDAISKITQTVKDLEDRGQICEPFPQTEGKEATG